VPDRDPDIHRDLGAHEAKIEQLQRDVEAIRTDLHRVVVAFEQARGGWRTIAILAGISATIGGFVAEFWSFIMAKPDGVP
jgi:type IV secretory pathway TrbD component